MKANFVKVVTTMVVTTVLILSLMGCKQATSQDPQFIGEGSNIMEYLGYNLKYPEEAIKAGVNIRVVYSFVVEEDGSVKDIELLTSHVDKDGNNPDVIASLRACEKTAYEIIESTSKLWKPAQKDNSPVKAEMHLPIWFKFY